MSREDDRLLDFSGFLDLSREAERLLEEVRLADLDRCLETERLREEDRALDFLLDSSSFFFAEACSARLLAAESASLFLSASSAFF